MSNKPSPAGTARVRWALQRILKLDQYISSIEKSAERLGPLKEERNSLRSEICTQMQKMDVDSSGNWGWDGRILWFLTELMKQATFGSDLYPGKHQHVGSNYSNCDKCGADRMEHQK